MKRATAILAVLAIFLLGLIAGVAGGHLYYSRLLSRPGGPPDVGMERFSRHLANRLELTMDQRDQIEEILTETRQISEEFRAEMEPRVRELLEDTRREIEGVLTPEQLREFARLRKSRQRRMERFLLGPPPPPGPKGDWRHRPPPRGERDGERRRDLRRREDQERREENPEESGQADG